MRGLLFLIWKIVMLLWLVYSCYILFLVGYCLEFGVVFLMGRVGLECFMSALC